MVFEQGRIRKQLLVNTSRGDNIFGEEKNTLTATGKVGLNGGYIRDGRRVQRVDVSVRIDKS